MLLFRLLTGLLLLASGTLLLTGQPLSALAVDQPHSFVAEAVREGRVSGGPPIAGFSDPPAAPHSGVQRSGIAPPPPRNGAAGRRRGHLRVLPDPAD